jgi:hypothetical protein
LGLALTGGRFENDVSGDGDAATWFWNLRLALQGRSDFTIGLEIGAAWVEPAGREGEDQVQVMEASINLRYYY